MPTIFFFTVKQEPESPQKDLPATPKSVSDNVDDSNYESDKDFEEPQRKREKFTLAPTPAQLGQAPLQRRLNLRK